MSAPVLRKPIPRILIVDDNPAIHRDFQKVLSGGDAPDPLQAAERDLFGQIATSGPQKNYLLTCVASGQDALAETERALKLSRPFSMAFIDMRMPGWDGLETTIQLLRVQPTLEIAICSAYMDYSWHEVLQRVQRAGLRLLRKPWTSGDVLGLVHEFCERAQARVVSNAMSSPR